MTTVIPTVTNNTLKGIKINDTEIDLKDIVKTLPLNAAEIGKIIEQYNKTQNASRQIEPNRRPNPFNPLAFSNVKLKTAEKTNNATTSKETPFMAELNRTLASRTNNIEVPKNVTAHKTLTQDERFDIIMSRAKNNISTTAGKDKLANNRDDERNQYINQNIKGTEYTNLDQEKKTAVDDYINNVALQPLWYNRFITFLSTYKISDTSTDNDVITKIKRLETYEKLSDENKKIIEKNKLIVSALEKAKQKKQALEKQQLEDNAKLLTFRQLIEDTTENLNLKFGTTNIEDLKAKIKQSEEYKKLEGFQAHTANNLIKGISGGRRRTKKRRYRRKTSKTKSIL